MALLLVAEQARAQQGWPINGDNWSFGSSGRFSGSYSTGGYYTPQTVSYSNYGDYSAPMRAPGDVVVGSPSNTPGQTVASYRSFYNAGTMPGDRPALINVRVPAQAQLWIDDVPMNTPTGALRQFQSQPLEPGFKYYYHVRARWIENGQQVERSQKVTFRAGEQANVNLMQQSSGVN
jgi:uncharacterized protein (TIGR03000 family)